ncbi:hypothetical protein D1641_12660 [Colidextribacter sp. OB.20]|uniref:hypothetical protein n=1 Tax=Colidextribacter sp. OB.20 TaxID=2304568 RepID=UPI00136CC9F1|nr:hypothetical protein [Colidextribacter sp. OB.20]NBI10858.1 hypothetical protein [Colidextribacter sp. OB.20]
MAENSLFPAKNAPEKFVKYSALTNIMETKSCIFLIDRVDITDVEKPVDNVEKPAVSGKTAVDNPVE